MKKLIVGSLALIAALLSVRADSSCASDANLCIDPTVTSGCSWSGTTGGINNVNANCWEGVGMLSSGQPCTWLVGPSFTVNLSSPATNELAVGSITITCPVGLAHQVQSMSMTLTVARGKTKATFQFYVSQCNGQGACAVSACRDGETYIPPANQGPPNQ